MSPYFTLIIPWVPVKYRTVWHPSVSRGPFSRLSRGTFPTLDEAIDWARAHLNGTPYEIREVGA